MELLELEEMLLLKKLISLSDIKAPQRIGKEDQELKRVEEILISMIEPDGLSLTSAEISDYLNAAFNDG